MIALLLVLCATAHAWWFPAQGQGAFAAQDKYLAPVELSSQILQVSFIQYWGSEVYGGNLGASLAYKSWRGWWWGQSTWSPAGREYFLNAGAAYQVEWGLWFLNLELYAPAPLWSAFSSANLEQIAPTVALMVPWGSHFAFSGALCPISTCTSADFAIQWIINQGTNMTVNINKTRHQPWILGVVQNVKIASHWGLRLGYWFPSRTINLATEFNFKRLAFSGSMSHHPQLTPGQAYSLQWH